MFSFMVYAWISFALMLAVGYGYYLYRMERQDLYWDDTPPFIHYELGGIDLEKLYHYRGLR